MKTLITSPGHLGESNGKHFERAQGFDLKSEYTDYQSL